MRAAWLAYYKALWCVRCYVWNPFVARVERAFDAADSVPRKWISRLV